MNVIKFSRIATATAISLWVLPAHAFTIGGQPSYSEHGLPSELSINNAVQVDDGDTQFTVLAPDTLNVSSLALEGTFEEFGITDNGTYSSVSSYITGFEFLGQAAVFNLDVGEDVLVGFSSSSRFTFDSEITGEIVDLDSNLLGTAAGSLSSIQTDEQSGNFSITLDETSTNLDTTTPTSVPSPNVMTGLLVFLISARCADDGKKAGKTKQQTS
ncbi:MAG: hypothetical protein AAGA83_22650 [Cyanobacteria bacterium P01_F01_bin.116]